MAKQKLTREQKIRRRRRLRRQMVGGVFFTLAVLGVVFIGTLIYGRVAALLDDTGDKEYYSNLYSSVVALDPVAFGSIEKADSNLLLEAAIWAAFSNEDTSKYQRNEYDQLLIPAIDVDLWASRMYGPSFKLTHRSFTDVTDGSISFEYDSEQQVYIMPITSQAGGYQGIVESITTSGNTKTLRMAYVQQDSEYAAYGSGAEELEVYKYMDYILVRDSGEYYLYAISTVEN